MSQIRNLRHRYGDFWIDIPLWDVLDRGITVLWGPSGSGKTSVIRLLLGLDGGAYEWVVDGVDIGSLPVPQKRIGVIFQNYDLFPHLTAGQNVEFAVDARGLKMDDFKKRIADYKSRLRLAECWDRRARYLSGGEQQRVALVRAIVTKPRLLFLDEPFSALDESLRHESRELVHELVKSEGIPTLLITHDKRDVQALAEQVSVLANGRILRTIRGQEIAAFCADN